MLTRRHIRIKIIQSVYSFSLDKGKKLKTKFYFLTKVYMTLIIYIILMLSLFKELKIHSKEQIWHMKKTT